MTSEWSYILLLVFLFYNLYLQHKLNEFKETIEDQAETMTMMAKELNSLGSPNVSFQYVSK